MSEHTKEKNKISEIELVNEYKSGVSLKELSKKYKIPKIELVKMLNNNGIGTDKFLKVESTYFNIEEYYKYLSEGLELGVIARKMLFSKPTLLCILRSSGIDTSNNYRAYTIANRKETTKALEQAMLIGRPNLDEYTYYRACDDMTSIKDIASYFGIEEKHLLFTITDNKWCMPREYRRGKHSAERVKDKERKAIASNYVNKFIELLEINMINGELNNEKLVDIANLLGVGGVPSLRTALRKNGCDEDLIKVYLYK